MNPQDPLAQLRDIHLPAAVSWWPPAPGWWLLTLLLLAGLGVLARVLWLRRQRRAYRRRGELELEQLFAHWQAGGDTRAFLQALNSLLKRIALYSFPGIEVAAMNGVRWTRFLDHNCAAGAGHSFSDGPLESGPYAPAVDAVDVEALHRSSLIWLREHQERPRD